MKSAASYRRSNVAMVATLVFAVLVCALGMPAQAQPVNSILLRNVVLINQSEGEGEVSVNILIKDSRLDIITEDLIPLEQADVSYDAMGGVLLGGLNLGETASFLILDGDPRSNVALLLDTKNHASFAIYQGEILKNNYVTIIEKTPEEKDRATQGWLAYSPPPLAVPLNYQDTGRWNHYNGKLFSGLFSGAVVLDRQNWLEQDSASHNQVGDLTEFDGGDIRALRFGAVGTINFDRPWVIVAAGATHAFDKGFDQVESDDFTLFDLRLDIPIWEKASFSIGKQKEPISMERVMPMTNMPMQERAAVSDGLLPSRNVGVLMAGTLFDEKMSLAGGVFNNWLDKDQPNSPGDNATQFVGRATWVPLVSADESTLLHLGAGLRYSNARESGSLKVGPEFGSAPDFVETLPLEADDIDTYSLEASLRSGPYWLHSEYLRMNLASQADGDPRLDGYHVTASWILSGEVREYQRRTGIFGGVPIARSVDQNGWGAWEVGARFSHLDMDEAPAEGGWGAGEMDIWSLGLNWWLSPYLNVNLNYRYITLDRFGEEGSSQGINSRIMLVLE